MSASARWPWECARCHGESIRCVAENASYYAELDERHKELVGETVEVGLMFASKAFVQLLVNPIVGPLTHKYVRIGDAHHKPDGVDN